MDYVLIEGIRLPNYGEVTVELQAGGNVRYVDAYGEFKYGRATTIPAHGRLIDADKMLAELETLPFGDRKIVLTLLIANAPTIIESEE